MFEGHMNDVRWKTPKMKVRSATCSIFRVVILGSSMLLAIAPGSARAQDDDKDSIWNLDKRIFDGFAKGLGLQKGDSVGLDYRERSPLVVPPTRDLPPPERAGAKQAAGWPVDPDAKRRVERSGSKKTLDARHFDDDYRGRALNPSELNPQGAAQRGRTATNKTSGNADPDGTNARPSELGYMGGLFSWSGFGFGGQKDEQSTFVKEPPRQALTGPPVGYQTPSAEQPYGVSKERVRKSVTPLDPAVGNLGN
jgi:hypothetical protein